MRILEKLQALQYGNEHGILLFSQDPVGLGGQISRRLLGLRLAILHHRKVVFPYLNEPPYSQVFLPIHSDINYSEALRNATDFRDPSAPQAKVIKINFWDLWECEEQRTKVQTAYPTELSEVCNPNLHYDGMLLSFCQLTPDNARFVDEAASRLAIDNKTLGIHIRRGDKAVETPFVPIEAINLEIRKLCETYGLNQVFACSDDEAVFKTLKMPAGVTLIFDETEKRYNNANHRFLIRNPDLAIQETMTAIKNIYLLGRCSKIIGQSNAHFATLAAAHIAFKTGGAFGTLIDGEYALRASPVAMITHSLKTSIRRLARKLLPWATIRHVGSSIRS